MYSPGHSDYLFWVERHHVPWVQGDRGGGGGGGRGLLHVDNDRGTTTTKTFKGIYWLNFHVTNLAMHIDLIHAAGIPVQDIPKPGLSG